MLTTRLYAVALALAGLNLSLAAAEDTITVCSSGCDFTSINAAIDSASHGDVIALSFEHYMEGEVIDFQRKGVTLRGTVDDDGNPTTILDGMNQHRVLITSFSSYQPPDDGSPPIRLENLIIQNGYGDLPGAALFVVRKNVSAITNCIFQFNTSNGSGGAARIEDSSPEITDCIFRNNTCIAPFDPFSPGGIRGWGGAISFDGSNSSLNRCVFTMNTTDLGGAIGARWYYYGVGFEIDIVDCTFTHNRAPQGGAIWVSGGSIVLNRCSLTRNGVGEGDLIYVDSSDFTPSPSFVQLTSCNVWCGPSYIGPGEWVNDGSCIGSPNTCSDACGQDSDLDGVVDDLDLCPEANDRADSDQDGTPDCLDGCPFNPDKTDPGACGCGPQPYVEGDLDCDGDYDAEDARLAMAEFGIIEAGACPADTNGDGAVDGQDLAAVLANWGLPCEG